MNRHHNRASVLISSAVVSGILAIVAGGFLAFISNEYSLNLRSHAWNQALHIAEAGVEAAFAEFNYYYSQAGAGFDSSRGWINCGGGEYLLPVYNLYDNNGRRLGAMYAWVRGVGSANPWVSGYGNCPTTPRGPSVWRRVDVGLRISSRFPAAMVAKQKLDMNGNDVYTDSYDSTDPSKSTTNLYDSAKRQANGDVASNDTVTNTVDIAIGNADIYGQVLVGPNGTVTMGSNGSIGPTFDSGARADTIQEALANGWLRKDFQVDIPDVTLPAGAAGWTSQGTINNTQTLTAGDYQASSVSLSGNNTLYITGNVRLYVTGEFKISGNGQMVITDGSKLELYVGGTCTIAGNGVVNNALTPINCQFYGLPTSTSWSLNGNGRWIGTVYAPQANLTLDGGGARGDMSGAIVAKNITLNGHVQFHYDESLRRAGPNAGYNMASWRSWRWDGNAWVAD